MKQVPARALLWLALILLIALSVYGFYSQRLFSQHIWDPQGIRKLIWLLVLYTAVFAIVIAWKKARFVHILVVAGFVYAALSVGIVPLLAAAYFLFSSLLLGKALVSALSGAQAKSASTAGPGNSIIALLVGLSVCVWIAGFLVRYPVNYSWLYALLLAFPVVWQPRLALNCLREWYDAISSVEVKGRLALVALWAVAFLALAYWLIALKPEVSSDGLAMHLAIPAAIANFHRFPFDPRETVWAVMPMNGDWGFAISYLLGGEYAARLFNLSLFGLAVALVCRMIRPWLSTASALLAVGLLASTPLAQHLSGSLFVENTWSVLLVGALVAGCRRDFLSAALLCGTAVATKFGAIAFVLAMAPLFALSIVRMAKSGEPKWRRVVVLAIVLFAITAAPPYIHAYFATGNPVFPFLNSVFRSPFFDSATSFSDGRFLAPLNWRTFFDLTFQSHRFQEGMDGAIGFHYFLLFPLALVLIRRDSPKLAKAAAWVAVVAVLLMFRTQSNLRYAYPALLLSAFPIAALFSWTKSAQPAFHKALCSAAIVSLALNVYFLPSAGWHHRGFVLNVLWNRGEVDRYIEESAPVRKLVEYVDRRNAGTAVAFVSTDQIAGLHGKAYVDNWHNDAFVRRIRSAQSAVECLGIMNDLGIRYVIAPTDQSGIPVREAPLQWLLREFTTPEFQFGKYYAARVERTPAGRPVSAARIAPGAALPEAIPGLYDDTSSHFSFYGPWTRDTQFIEPLFHTLIYTDRPAAYFRFAFVGTEVTYVYTKASNRGIARLTIDGKEIAEVDLYSPATVWQARSTIRNLPRGRHVLRVEILDRKNPSASGRFVDVDGLEVH